MRDLGDPIEAPMVKLDRENFKIAIRLEVNIQEDWFVPEEIDRYIQVKFMQRNITVAQVLGDQKSSKNVKTKLLQAQKCNARFFGEVETRLNPELLSYFRCPVTDFKLNLAGSQSSGTSLLGIAGVQLCE